MCEKLISFVEVFLFQDRQEVKLTYEKHRGQREDFPAGEILQVFTETTQRRHVFTPLIQGMLFSVTARLENS